MNSDLWWFCLLIVGALVVVGLAAVFWNWLMTVEAAEHDE